MSNFFSSPICSDGHAPEKSKLAEDLLLTIGTPLVDLEVSGSCRCSCWCILVLQPEWWAHLLLRWGYIDGHVAIWLL